MNPQINPRIQELAIECYNPYSNFDHERFAELIVKEAIAVVQRRFMGDLNREDLEVRRCVEELKLHFGVEL